MKEAEANTKEPVANPLIEAIYQIHSAGTVVCQGCGERLRPGERASAVVSRARNSRRWRAREAHCARHSPALTTHATRDSSDLVVTGRVGWCSDEMTQRHYPVLFEPELRAVSALDTRETRVVGEPFCEPRVDPHPRLKPIGGE